MKALRLLAILLLFAASAMAKDSTAQIKVSGMTCGACAVSVKSLVRDHTRVPALVSYVFCRTPECDVVYFSDQAVFRKPDLKVRVGVKETADPVPLCYCFDYSREDVRRDIETAGTTRILDDIKAEVQAG